VWEGVGIRFKGLSCGDGRPGVALLVVRQTGGEWVRGGERRGEKRNQFVVKWFWCAGFGVGLVCDFGGRGGVDRLLRGKYGVIACEARRKTAGGLVSVQDGR
jgi:hypothetical protein